MHVNPADFAMRMTRRLARLRGDRGGLALIEFALGAPIVLTIGGYGLELSNLSITHMRVSQIALNLADHASRVGLTSTLTPTQLREADVNDVMAGARARCQNDRSSPGGKMPTRVLIVEDDASVRLLVMEVLRELGYRAIEASDSDGAIPILQSDTRIDLLISDVGLPGLNGRQLAEIARQRGDDEFALLLEHDHHRPRVGQRASTFDDQLEHVIEIGLAGERLRDLARGLEG